MFHKVVPSGIIWLSSTKLVKLVEMLTCAFFSVRAGLITTL